MKIHKTTVHFIGGTLDGEVRVENGMFPRNFVISTKRENTSIHETYVQLGEQIDADAGTSVCHMRLDQVEIELPQ